MMGELTKDQQDQVRDLQKSLPRFREWIQWTRAEVVHGYTEEWMKLVRLFPPQKDEGIVYVTLPHKVKRQAKRLPVCPCCGRRHRKGESV